MVGLWIDIMRDKSPTGPGEETRFEDLAGWSEDNHAIAFTAFRRSCKKILTQSDGDAMGSGGGQVKDWRAVCEKALAVADKKNDGDARAFFEGNFSPVAITGTEGADGLFTGYFEPEVLGSLSKSTEFAVPLYTRPSDLVAFDDTVDRRDDAKDLKYGRIVNGKAVPYYSRREIEQGALKGKVPPLVYLKDKIDAFFVHIQGSSRIRLPDDTVMRVAFAGKTGRAYTPIGRILIDRGEITREEVSMQSIRAWLAKNSKDADDIMWHNESFIFFRQVAMADPNLGPPGAQGVLLTPGRSLAVDRRVHGYGMPLWLDASVPAQSGNGNVPFRRLMVAQDTGSAILGAVRGDVFWGSGMAAGDIAGRMKHQGRMFAILPKALAARRASAGTAVSQ